MSFNGRGRPAPPPAPAIPKTQTAPLLPPAASGLADAPDASAAQAPSALEKARAVIGELEEREGIAALARPETQEQGLKRVFDRSSPAANAMSAPSGSDGGEKPGKPDEDVSRLPVERQIEIYLDEFQVPEEDRPLRRKLTMQAWERILLDIPLFLDNPRVRVRPGPWWITAQDLLRPEAKEIFVPVRDIFIRAVDPAGVEEAVGFARHESKGHYELTRPDLDFPLTAKYALPTSPSANNLLYNWIEDTRVNTYDLIQNPGSKPYYDAAYGALWPENPDEVDKLEQRRKSMLSRSSVKVDEESWMPPHLQYVNTTIYYWRHRKAPPFLTDHLALEAFEKTKDSLDRIRNIHPQAYGGVVLEAMKTRAWREAVEAIDREIWPHYEPLVERSRQQLKDMLKRGAKVKSQNPSCSRPGDQEAPDKKDGPGRTRPNMDLEREAGDILEHLDKDSDEGVHGHASEDGRHRHASGGEDPPAPQPSEDGDDESFAKRREKAVRGDAAMRSGFTLWQRYKLEAERLGFIKKFDGVIKKMLLPTRHARFGKSHYHEGDEPDMDKYFDDAAQGRYDTPIMRRMNKRIRRSAKLELVLDVSGSMGELSEAMDSPLDYALLAVVAWVEVCQNNALDFEVMLFTDTQEIIHAFGEKIDKAAKDRMIAAIAHAKRGWTAMGAAFKRALDRILGQHATNRFIFFATDELHNTGEDPRTWAELARKNKVVTISLNMAKDASKYDHPDYFDYTIRVSEPKDMPTLLLDALQRAVRAMLRSSGFSR